MLTLKSQTWGVMQFHERLLTLRKARGLTQRALAEAASVHVTQIQRYEAGAMQPTLDALRALALGLSVSADMLIFDDDERRPADDLKFFFEAVSQFGPEDKAMAKKIIQGLILQHQTKRVLEAP